MIQIQVGEMGWEESEGEGKDKEERKEKGKVKLTKQTKKTPSKNLTPKQNKDIKVRCHSVWCLGE